MIQYNEYLIILESLQYLSQKSILDLVETDRLVVPTPVPPRDVKKVGLVHITMIIIMMITINNMIIMIILPRNVQKVRLVQVHIRVIITAMITIIVIITIIITNIITISTR